jgi:PIN domain nuclease of toxin-antitoxin system
LIVLDTHVWIWWLDGQDGRLSPAALTAINEASNIAISAWSCWEIATLARRGRVSLDRPVARWLAEARATSGVESIAVRDEIAQAAGELPSDFPGDPSDRIIYATATLSGPAS